MLVAFVESLLSGLRPRARRVWRERAALALGEPPASRSAKRLARRWRRGKGMLTELTWHPERSARMPVHGVDALEEARRSGRGVLIVTIHIGPLLALVHALSARGVKLYIAGGHRPWEPPANRHIVFMNRRVEDAGARWVHVGGSFPVLRALLERGETCFMMFDVPGAFRTRLGGRPAALSESFAHLAANTDALVVPAYALHRRGHMQGQLLPPMEPAEGEDPSAFAHRVAAAFDDVIVSHLDQAQLAMTDVWQAAAGEVTPS
jgi:lauroyl/myristoyl acyltransferase